jgi:DnaJ-class molecular chaperone
VEQYFEILKIKPGASIEEVKRAYKAQVKVWHPDRFSTESLRLQKKAHGMFQKITEAYKKIIDAHISHIYSETSGWKGKSTQYTRASRKPTKTSPEQDNQEFESVPGFTTRVWPNGDKYEGQVFQEQMHGRGIFTSFQGYVYTGEFKYGKPSGLGKLVYENGDQYEGSFVNDMLHGKGKYLYANRDCY